MNLYLIIIVGTMWVSMVAYMLYFTAIKIQYIPVKTRLFSLVCTLFLPGMIFIFSDLFNDYMMINYIENKYKVKVHTVSDYYQVDDIKSKDLYELLSEVSKR